VVNIKIISVFLHIWRTANLQMTIRHILPTRNAVEIFMFKYMGQKSVSCHSGKYEDSNVQTQRFVTPTCLVASLNPQINVYIYSIHQLF